MVKLTKNNGEKIIVNSDEIEFIDYSYDTKIHLISGKVLIVKETPDEIRQKVIDYRRACYSNLIDKNSI